MKIAAIDIGTNSLHMVVVRIHRDGSYEVVDREKEMARLGKGGLLEHRLTEDAIELGLSALSRMKKLSVAHGCEYLVAAATSAVREAENRAQLLDRVRDELGIRIQVLSGEEEADLIFRAVREGTDLSGRKALVMDLGGGSTEVILGNNFGPQMRESLPIGVVRFTDAYAQNPGVTSAKRYRALAKEVRQLAGPTLERARGMGFDVTIGCSGTFRQVGELLRTPEKEIAGDVVHIPSFTLAELEALVEQLQGLDLKERAKLVGLNPKRAGGIAVGATAVLELLRLAGAETVRLSSRALRDGLVLETIRALPHPEAPENDDRGLRRRSVMRLSRTHPGSMAHGARVGRLALALFDQTGGLHGLDARDRELLAHAAQLHDVGLAIGYTRHHKHSYYVITNADLHGFDPEEVVELALLARYHRKSLPREGHPEFGALPAARRPAVAALAGLLKLADGLDRAQRDAVRDLRVHHLGERLRVELTGDPDLELELAAAERKRDLLERLWERPIEVVQGESPARHDSPRLAFNNLAEDS